MLFWDIPTSNGITFLLLVKMDVERQIDKLEIEAIVNNNFDDARISF